MNLLYVFLISAVPVFEQRAGIPLGIIKFNMNPLLIFFISFAGSLLPVPFILVLFNTIMKWMRKYKFFNAFSNFIDRKITKNTPKIQKYKEIGLILFVAIPLPTTGLWTGSAIAAFLKMDLKKSFLYIALGGLMSAVIITILSIIFPTILGY